jgi:hypothetical protein
VILALFPSFAAADTGCGDSSYYPRIDERLAQGPVPTDARLPYTVGRYPSYDPELFRSDDGSAVPVDVLPTVVVPQEELEPNTSYTLRIAWPLETVGTNGTQPEDDVHVEFVTGPGPTAVDAAPEITRLTLLREETISDYCGPGGSGTRADLEIVVPPADLLSVIYVEGSHFTGLHALYVTEADEGQTRVLQGIVRDSAPREVCPRARIIDAAGESHAGEETCFESGYGGCAVTGGAPVGAVALLALAALRRSPRAASGRSTRRARIPSARRG